MRINRSFVPGRRESGPAREARVRNLVTEPIVLVTVRVVGAFVAGKVRDSTHFARPVDGLHVALERIWIASAGSRALQEISGSTPGFDAGNIPLRLGVKVGDLAVILHTVQAASKVLRDKDRVVFVDREAQRREKPVGEGLRF